MNFTKKMFVVCFFSLSVFAQSVTVGSQSVTGGVSFSGSSSYTLIDLSHPASTNGTLSYASVAWVGKAGCGNAFKLKFFRPASPQTLTTFSLVAERGPFTAVAGRNLVALNPPVDVIAGDLIALTTLVPSNTCGSPTSRLQPNAALMKLNGDVSAGSFNGFYLREQALAVRATDTLEVLEGVIPAVGAVQGAAGSFFRTSLQVACPGGGTCTGKFIYHPAGVAASPNDQQFPYTVSSAEATAYSDIVTTMGKSGLGTLDVISTNGFPPLITARVYNDAGASGTSGFTEEMITPGRALHPGDLAVLLTPHDLTSYRMNIGVRTLSSNATVNVQYGFRSQGNKDFPADTFTQQTLTAFGDATPVEDEQIFFYVLSGDVIIYASTTDNRTNDSSVEFMRRQ